jgi:hypothetical protein
MSELSASPGPGAPRPPSGRRRRWLAVGLPLLLAGFAANHLEHRIRRVRIDAAAGDGGLVVRAEGGVLGHNQIGIDESSLEGSGGVPLLRFAELGRWEFDPRKPTPCPGEIAVLSGREASCVGFMYPLEAGTKLRLFCLLRTTQTCCYGPRPQYNQYLFVELKEPVKFERLAPVTVRGSFFVDPRPDEGYIYRMEGTSVTSAAAEQPELDGAGAAAELGLPLFDFAALAGVKSAKDPAEVPAELARLDGQRVVMEGFILNREEGKSPRLVLARDWWDGKAQGKPPTIYSAAKVSLRPGGRLPPAWRQKGVFAGTLRVTRDAAARPTEGVVSLQDAVRADVDPGALIDAGPLLPVPLEAVLLAAFLFLALRSGRSARAAGKGAAEETRGGDSP